MSSAKWVILNGVKYPVDEDNSPLPQKKNFLPRRNLPIHPPKKNPKKTIKNSRVIRTATGTDMRPLVQRNLTKKWHWSLASEKGWKSDYKTAIERSCIAIHGVSDEWTGRKHDRRRNSFSEFKANANPGDKIYMYCGGLLRAKGIFTGEIFPISNKEAEKMSTSLPPPEVTKPPHSVSRGSFIAMVESWEELSTAKKGNGMRATLYEIKQGMKNESNYH